MLAWTKHKWCIQNTHSLMRQSFHILSLSVYWRNNYKRWVDRSRFNDLVTFLTKWRDWVSVLVKCFYLRFSFHFNIYKYYHYRSFFGIISPFSTTYAMHGESIKTESGRDRQIDRKEKEREWKKIRSPFFFSHPTWDRLILVNLSKLPWKKVKCIM